MQTLRLLLLVAFPGTSFAAFVRADEPPIAEPGEASQADDDLVKRLLDGIPDGEAPVDPLSAAADLMERAGRRIAEEKDSGTETRALQGRAIADLEKMIELAKQQRQRGGSPSPPKPDQPMGDGEGEGEAEAGESEADGTGAAGEGERRRDDGEASESADVTARADDAEAMLAARRQLVKDVWGHLPATVREELLNAYGDRALPKYEALVKAYYRALAEKTDDEVE